MIGELRQYHLAAGIGRRAVLLIDPLDVAQIAEVIYNVLSFQALSKSFREKGQERVKNFSWEEAARETI